MDIEHHVNILCNRKKEHYETIKSVLRYLNIILLKVDNEC